MKRNDINHFGFSKNVSTYKTLEKDIKGYYNDFLEIINKNPVEKLYTKEMKIRRMLLAFSHKLTKIQREDAKVNLGIEEFIYLPPELQSIWSNIDPNLEYIENELNEIIQWIDESASEGDYILIQGDFGATYHLVEYCKSKDLRPVYSTTKREAIETKKDNNTIVLSHKVSHIKYREY